MAVGSAAQPVPAENHHAGHRTSPSVRLAVDGVGEDARLSEQENTEFTKRLTSEPQQVTHYKYTPGEGTYNLFIRLNKYIIDNKSLTGCSWKYKILPNITSKQSFAVEILIL